MDSLTRRMIDIARLEKKKEKDKKDIFNPILAHMNKCPEKEVNESEKNKKKLK